MGDFLFYLVCDISCLFDTNFAAICLLANTSSSGIEVSDQHNETMDTDSKTVGAALDWSWLIKATVNWTGRKNRYAVIVSTGKLSPPLPQGFAIQSRHRFARMQGSDYNIPDVPYTMYYSGNYAIHGTYWHHRFGTPVSHGCINVAVDHARWTGPLWARHSRAWLVYTWT